MKTFRCLLSGLEYALEAVHVVKYEEDHNPPELATKETMLKFLSNKQNYFLVAMIDHIVVGFAVAYELQHNSDKYCHKYGKIQSLKRIKR